MRAAAELYYDDNNGYGTAGTGSVTSAGVWTGGTGVCGSGAGNIRSGVAAAAAAAGGAGVCNVSTTGWAASSALKTSAGSCLEGPATPSWNR